MTLGDWQQAFCTCHVLCNVPHKAVEKDIKEGERSHLQIYALFGSQFVGSVQHDAIGAVDEGLESESSMIHVVRKEAKEGKVR
mmetsp:Transcript_3319/g.7341  ORF Transcript_3319/g.7341 Transcript_3319/m.7341 type:complete len:83 (-) Transcript_3319:333-581(-)